MMEGAVRRCGRRVTRTWKAGVLTFSGVAVDSDDYASQVLAITTASVHVAEKELLDIFENDDTDKRKREEVQRVVRTLRSRGLKEKEVLATALYKQSFSILKSK